MFFLFFGLTINSQAAEIVNGSIMNFLLDGAVSYFSKDASWDDYFLRSELLSVPVVSSTIIFTGKITNDKRLKTGRCIAGTAVGSLVGGTALYIYVKKIQPANWSEGSEGYRFLLYILLYGANRIFPSITGTIWGHFLDGDGD